MIVPSASRRKAASAERCMKTTSLLSKAVLSATPVGEGGDAEVAARCLNGHDMVLFDYVDSYENMRGAVESSSLLHHC